MKSSYLENTPVYSSTAFHWSGTKGMTSYNTLLTIAMKGKHSLYAHDKNMGTPSLNIRSAKSGLIRTFFAYGMSRLDSGKPRALLFSSKDLTGQPDLKLEVIL